MVHRVRQTFVTHRNWLTAAMLLLLVAAGLLVWLRVRTKTSVRGPAEVTASREVAAQLHPTEVAGGTPNALPQDDGRRTSVPASVTIRVRSERAEPVRAATIWYLAEEQCHLLGSTGDTGALEIAASKLPQVGEVAAIADTYQTATKSTSDLNHNVLDIVLAQGAHISGAVEFDGQPAVDANIRIVAVPDSVFRRKPPSRRDLAFCEMAYAVTTDSAGDFKIGGLELGMPYWLEATVADPHVRFGATAQWVVASQDDITLTLEDVFGVILQFSSDDEVHLQKLFRRPVARTRVPAGLHRFDRWPCVGMPFGSIDMSACGFCIPVLYSRQPGSTGPVTIPYEGSIAGFEPFRLELHLARLRGRVLPVQRVELTRNTVGVGSLRVGLTGPGAAVVLRRGLRGSLRLTQSDGQTFSRSVEWPPLQSETELTAIPAGPYSWTFEADSGWLSGLGTREEDARSALMVSQDETASISVALPECGYVHLECHGPHGPVSALVQVADGPVFTERGAAKQIRFVRCLRDGELVGPLAAGQYDFCLVGELVPPPGLSQSITVRAGETSDCVFVVP